MKGLSGKHFLVWRFLQQAGARFCQWSVRKIHVALGISRSTVEKALKALNALGFIRTRPGTYNRASEHEILQTLTPAAPAPEFADAPAPNFRDSEGPSGENRDTPPEKSGHPGTGICLVCAASLGYVPRASVKAISVDGEEALEAYKLAPQGPVEMLEIIKTEVRAAVARARLVEIQGKPLDDFTVHCMSRPLARLPEAWQMKQVIGLLEDKCLKERQRPRAETWGLMTKVVSDEVARYVGPIPYRRPAASSETRDPHGSDASVRKVEEMRANGGFR